MAGPILWLSPLNMQPGGRNSSTSAQGGMLLLGDVCWGLFAVVLAEYLASLRYWWLLPLQAAGIALSAPCPEPLGMAGAAICLE